MTPEELVVRGEAPVKPEFVRKAARVKVDAVTGRFGAVPAADGGQAPLQKKSKNQLRKVGWHVGMWPSVWYKTGSVAAGTQRLPDGQAGLRGNEACPRCHEASRLQLLSRAAPPAGCAVAGARQAALLQDRALQHAGPGHLQLWRFLQARGLGPQLGPQLGSQLGKQKFQRV
jgi:hypothetical protein